MKERYKRPEIVEYGKVEDLTLGQTGSSPDDVIIAGTLININNICDPTLPHPGLICS